LGGKKKRNRKFAKTNEKKSNKQRDKQWREENER